jgi:hypothetical protein
MSKKKVIGVCKLCGRRRRLCRSHYLGKALFKLTRENGKHPIILTPKIIAPSPRQMSAHLLCEECEHRFKMREDVALALMNGNNGFPLLERMKLALTVEQGDKVVTFSGAAMGINTDALAYFALSLLWRGSVHVWKTLKGQTTSVRLGKYEERIRRYLLGETALPDGVYVMVAVCIDVGAQGTTFPPHLLEGSKYQTYSILVRGLWFHVVADDEAPSAGTSRLCCVKSPKKLIFLKNCSEEFLLAGSHLRSTAEVDSRLR